MKEVVIIDAVRSPIGNVGGSLATIRPDDLLADILKGLVNRTGIDPALITDVYAGCGNQAGEDNRNVARMATLLAGFPVAVPGVTVNRNCSSGLEAINQAAKAIIAGEGDIFIGCGVESMSRAPLVMPGPSTVSKIGHRPIYDSTVGWRFENPKMNKLYPIVSLGETAENVADNYNIGRAEQDEFSLQSQERAINAINAGKFNDEIIEISISQRKGRPIIFKTDEYPRYRQENGRLILNTSIEKLSELKPAFRKGGTVTAGNSSGINDGAAAILMMSKERAEELKLKPIAKWKGSAAAGVDPSMMGIGPVPSTNKLLNRLLLDINDIGLIEINEAFAMVTMLTTRALDLDPACVNVHGGACAQGHPIGSTGSRIIVTLMHALEHYGKQRGVAALCIGGGEATAVAIELVA